MALRLVERAVLADPIPRPFWPRWPQDWPFGVPAGWRTWHGWWPSPSGPAWTVYVQCRDAGASANTVLPDWCWRGRQVPTCAVVPGLRNGVPCRCHCPPGRCEGKRGVARRFRPHL